MENPQSNPSSKNTSTLQSVLEALLNTDRVFPPRLLTFFSDISEKDLLAVREIWGQVSVERKQSLLADLEVLMEADSLLCCDELAKFALADQDPQIRSRAVSLLWECEDPRLIKKLDAMLHNDPDPTVQVSAAAGLGRFVLLGELDEIPESVSRQALTSLKNRQSQNSPKELQQEILKSLAYTGSAEVSRRIEAAFADKEPSWRLAAIIAMGRSADERWEDQVLESLNSPISAIQNEAIKAAGDIELESARQPLLDMLDEGVPDLETRLHLAWALARIGGEDVKPALQTLLDEAQDEEEIDVIEMALEHLEFSEELPDLDL